MENRLVRGLITAVEWVCTGTLLGILVMVFLQILFRDVLRTSAPWTEEGARYLLVAMVYLGAVVAFERRNHVTLALVRNAGKWARTIMGIIGDLVVGGCSVVIVFGSVVMTRMNWHIPSITITFAPLGILYVFSGVGAALVAVLSIYRIGRTLAGR